MIKKKQVQETEVPKKNVPNQGGSMTGWAVEARVTEISSRHPVTYPDPYSGERILTTDWTHISFFKGLNPAGVPTGSTCEPILDQIGLLGKLSAKALGYTFAAQRADIMGNVKVRIVPHRINYKIEYPQEGEPELLVGKPQTVEEMIDRLNP